MAKEKLNNSDFNLEWEKEIASFDYEREQSEKEFREHHLTLEDIEKAGLSEEELIIFKLFLSGTTVEEIAKKVEADIDAVDDVIDLARIKLAMED